DGRDRRALQRRVNRPLVALRSHSAFWQPCRCAGRSRPRKGLRKRRRIVTKAIIFPDCSCESAVATAFRRPRRRTELERKYRRRDNRSTVGEIAATRKTARPDRKRRPAD